MHHKRLMIEEIKFVSAGSRNQQAGSLRSPDPGPYLDCKQATLQTSSRNDSRVWAGVVYSRSLATGSAPHAATGKRRGGAGADSIGQDLHLRAALSEPENSGGVHRS